MVNFNGIVNKKIRAVKIADTEDSLTSVWSSANLKQSIKQKSQVIFYEYQCHSPLFLNGGHRLTVGLAMRGLSVLEALKGEGNGDI